MLKSDRALLLAVAAILQPSYPHLDPLVESIMLAEQTANAEPGEATPADGEPAAAADTAAQ